MLEPYISPPLPPLLSLYPTTTPIVLSRFLIRAVRRMRSNPLGGFSGNPQLWVRSVPREGFERLGQDNRNRTPFV